MYWQGRFCVPPVPGLRDHRNHILFTSCQCIGRGGSECVHHQDLWGYCNHTLSTSCLFLPGSVLLTYSCMVLWWGSWQSALLCLVVLCHQCRNVTSSVKVEVTNTVTTPPHGPIFTLGKLRGPWVWQLLPQFLTTFHQ